MEDELFNIMECPTCHNQVMVTDKRVSPQNSAILLFGVCMHCKGQGRNSKILGVVPVERTFCRMMQQMGLPVFDLEVEE